MRVVIMGCGRTGAALAIEMSRAGHDIHVLDTDPASFRFLPKDFSGQTHIGNGIDLDVLRKIGVEKADVFVSTTRGDNRNVMAAQIARHIFGVPVAATRVFDPLREQMYRNLGLRTINPTRVQARRLKRIIEAPSEEASNAIADEFMRADSV
jgi:trk system potassium uptake protein TrkA